MPIINFATAPNPTEAQIVAVIEGVIGTGRPLGMAYNFDLGILFYVDLADATQTEADAVQAALIAAFPAQTAGAQFEPHALLCMLDAAPQVWTNMPAALTEFRGNAAFRAGCSMRKVEQVRLVVNVLTVGVAGAILAAQWSTGAAFAFFDTVVSGPQVAINTLGFKVSAWTNVPSGARADGVAIRIIGQGGNGVADPEFGQVLVEGR
jgi:hypothetical protein